MLQNSKSKQIACVGGGAVALVLGALFWRRRRRGRKQATAAAPKQPIASMSLSDSISYASQQQLQLPMYIRPDKLPASVGGWAIGEATWLYDRCAIVPLQVPIGAHREHRLAKEPSLEGAFLRINILKAFDTPEMYCEKRQLRCVPLSSESNTVFSYQIFDGTQADGGSVVEIGRNIERPDGSIAMCTLSFQGAQLPTTWEEMYSEGNSNALRLEQLLSAIEIAADGSAAANGDEGSSGAAADVGLLEVAVQGPTTCGSVCVFSLACDQLSVAHNLANNTLDIRRGELAVSVPLNEHPTRWDVNVLAACRVESPTTESAETHDADHTHAHHDADRRQWHPLTPKNNNNNTHHKDQVHTPLQLALTYRRNGSPFSFAVRDGVIVSDAVFGALPMVLLQYPSPLHVVATVTQMDQPKFPQGWVEMPLNASASLIAEIFEENVSHFIARPAAYCAATQHPRRSAIESWTVSGLRALTFVETDFDWQAQAPITCRTVVVPDPTHQQHIWMIRWQTPSSEWELCLPQLHELLASCVVTA